MKMPYIFAENLHDMGLMTTRDYENYQAMFDNITEFIKPPDLLVYLKGICPYPGKQYTAPRP